MDNKAIAAKIARLRERANDKSLPQDVRNTMLDEAVKLEQEAAKRAGVRLAKGGMAMPMVEKDGTKVPAFAADGVGKMAKGGAVKKMMYGGDVSRELPKRGSRTAKNMAMGGMAKMSPMGYAKGGMVKANCGASVPASKGKK